MQKKRGNGDNLKFELDSWFQFSKLFGIKKELSKPIAKNATQCMDDKQITKILIEFTEQLLKTTDEHIQMIRWFGSTVRKDANEHSDIDILVLSDAENSTIRNIAFDVSAEVSLAYDCLLSVLFMSSSRYLAMKKAGRLLTRNIERDGVVLWQRNN